MRGDSFSGTKTPAPPTDLRARVMRAAHAAVNGTSRATAARWGFNRFDLAWVAGLVVLLLANVLLPLPGGRTRTNPGASRAVAETRQLERELALKGPIVVNVGNETGGDARSRNELRRELDRL